MDKSIVIGFFVCAVFVGVIVICGCLTVLYSTIMKTERERKKRTQERISNSAFDIDDHNITWDIMGSEPKSTISNNSVELSIPAETRMRNLTANILHQFVEFMESTDDVSLDELEQSVYDEIYNFLFPNGIEVQSHSEIMNKIKEVK